jgi:hypothetical protein
MPKRKSWLRSVSTVDIEFEGIADLHRELQLVFLTHLSIGEEPWKSSQA